MVITATVVGFVILYGVSLLSTWVALRDPRKNNRAHALVWAARSFTIGSAFLVSYFGIRKYQARSTDVAQVDDYLWYGSIGLFTLGAVVWLFVHVRRHRQALAHPELSRHRAPWTERLKFLRDLSRSNWKRLEAPAYSLEDSTGASRSATAVVVGSTVVVFPLVLILLAASMLTNLRGSAASEFASHTIGYYTLLIATSWTIVFLATILLVAVLQLLRGRSSELNLSFSNVVISVGTWAGLGAAGGVFVGALIPALVLSLPEGSFRFLDTTLLDTISSDLLLDISASGAILGFLVGEVISLTKFAEGEENLVVRTVFPPVLFGALATITGYFGLRPGFMSTRLAEMYKEDMLVADLGGADPFVTSTIVDLGSSEGWGALVASFDEHGWNKFVDQNLYLWITWVLVALVVIFGFSWALYRRELELVEAEMPHHPPNGSQPSGVS